MRNAKVRLTTRTPLVARGSGGRNRTCVSGYERAVVVHALGSGYRSKSAIDRAKRDEVGKNRAQKEARDQ
jgi:hypothetical protein